VRTIQAAVVAILLVAGFVVQVHFLAAYPQPILFGDPGAYYVVGQKLQQAWAGLLSGESAAVVFDSIRGLLYFAGVGALYGIIDAVRPQDIPYFRVVLAAFNTLAMLGCFLLARRLSGLYLGGLAALAIAFVYPSFSVQTGRLFPDPVTGCFLVWSAWCYLEAVHRRSRKWMFASGLGKPTLEVEGASQRRNSWGEPRLAFLY